MKSLTGIIFFCSTFIIYGTGKNVLFSRSLDRKAESLACCDDDDALSCDQIDLDVATLGKEDVELAPLGATVKFMGMVGDNDHAYHYGNEDLEMVVTYHAEKGSL